MADDFCDVVWRLRSHFFAKDRDVVLQTGRVFEGTATVPIGGVIFWPSTAGAIPTGWTEFAALQGRFPVGADGATFVNGASGGAETINIRHLHGNGSLAAASDSHSHGNGSLAAANDTHSHGPGTLTPTGTPSSSDGMSIGVNDVASDFHTHTLTGSTAGDTHGHTVSGSTASDSHSHNVTGSTANALSTTQSILPPYHVGTWIQRIS